jgi:hypothetical protein
MKSYEILPSLYSPFQIRFEPSIFMKFSLNFMPLGTTTTPYILFPVVSDNVTVDVEQWAITTRNLVS